MEFQFPHLEHFTEDFHQIADRFRLNPDHLKIEFYRPSSQVILVEAVGDHAFKIHIDLEEHRIISIQTLSACKKEEADFIKRKYRRFMT
ncbi:MAG: hypothetical protein ACE5HO_21325 [bacterium]